MIPSVSTRRTAPSQRTRPTRGLVCRELVHATGEGSGGLPVYFQWRGRRYRIAAVDGGKTRLGSASGARVFTVRTTSGMRCELEHRTESDVWMMSRVLATA